MRCMVVENKDIKFIDLAAQTFCSRPAFAMWRIAIGLAEFEPNELWEEVKAQKTKGAARINESTILTAMDIVHKRHLQT